MKYGDGENMRKTYIRKAKKYFSGTRRTKVNLLQRYILMLELWELLLQ